MKKHDSLGSHDTGPSEVETQVDKVTAERMGEVEAKLIAAHIEQDTVNLVLRTLGPLIRQLVEAAIAAA